MRGLRKKIIALAAVAAMAMTSFVGCGSVDDSEIVATVGDSEITVGMANFFARYQQPAFEEYYVSYQDYQQQMIYGSVMYETEMDWGVEQEEGVTLEDTYKDDMMTSLQELYILEDHMDEYGVELTEDEVSAINKAAKAFVKANSDDVKEKISADKETVAELLKLMTISVKVQEAIKEEANITVTDEEAAQKRLRYVNFVKSTTSEDSEVVEMTEDEIADLKKEAKAFRKAAKANGSLEAYSTEVEETSYTTTYDAGYAEDEYAELPTEVYEAAEKLEEGGFSKVIDTDEAFYVVQLESLMDADATATEKESIIAEREEEAVTEKIESWRDETKIKVNEKVWAKINIEELLITVKEDESDDVAVEEGGTVEDTTTEDTTAEDTTTEE